MKKHILTGIFALSILTMDTMAQKVKGTDVPMPVKSALMKKYPSASGVTWEKEHGNFEANWGGRSKEDNSVTFTPEGSFVEIVVAIPVAELPAAVHTYIKAHYAGATIKEAGKITDAKGAISYEAEVKRKGLIFDEKGNFIKAN